jgi:hypothetical protein
MISSFLYVSYLYVSLQARLCWTWLAWRAMRRAWLSARLGCDWRDAVARQETINSEQASAHCELTRAAREEACQDEGKVGVVGDGWADHE